MFLCATFRFSPCSISLFPTSCSHVAWLCPQLVAFWQQRCFSRDVATFVSVSFAAPNTTSSVGPSFSLSISHIHGLSLWANHLSHLPLSLSLCHFCTFRKHFYGLPFAAAARQPLHFSLSGSPSPIPSAPRHTPLPCIGILFMRQSILLLLLNTGNRFPWARLRQPCMLPAKCQTRPKVSQVKHLEVPRKSATN